jgi:hypothetical protein
LAFATGRTRPALLGRKPGLPRQGELVGALRPRMVKELKL